MNYMTVTQLAKMLGYSRARLYMLIEDGTIKTEKAGDLRLIPKKEAEKWIERAKGGRWHTFPRRPSVRKKSGTV